MSNERNKYNIVLSGVGGQGVLSVAAVVSMAAMKEGYKIRQSEVHGMAQRGGAVLANLRISKEFIESDLIPKGDADVILSMEPMESLRYVDYLKSEGVIITAEEPFINIPNYPEIEDIYKVLNNKDGNKIISTKELAKEAGSARAVNMVMVGALSNVLPISQEALEASITELFERKGEKIVETNLKAFKLGKEAGK
ncbi:MAG: indolepyruvate oxidoreductase subunit beta [Sneathiellales bacterium]|nr:indolepyruvate oxidoreductase subunit beta [Sneathiellales bacterium]